MADHNGHTEPATLQEVRDILREVAQDRRMLGAEQHKLAAEQHKLAAEQHKLAAEQRKLTVDLRELAESHRETEREMREGARRQRKLDDLFNGQWGKLMEALVAGDLIKLLNERGIAVDHTSTNVKKEYGARRWELDILAVNGDEVVVVEVKTTLKVYHVDRLIGLLRDLPDLMREYAGSTIYGAVAYLKADESSDTYAERNGLFVIRATGSSASITNPPDFRPRRFGRGTPTPSRSR